MISVVIPCYNAATTIAATIDSTLVQDTPHEIIVVDDGSTDNSAQLLASFGDRVRWLTTPNRGASAARTTGTDLAQGRFIQYLDSDDLLMPGTLAARRAALEAMCGDVAHTDWQKFSVDAAGSTIECEIIRPDLVAIAADPEVATSSARFWAPPAALLYTRSIVDRIGSWHDRLPVIQDARFLFDAARHGARFVHVPGVGARYRVAAGSLSRRNRARFIADCALNGDEIERLWRARGPLSPAKREALAGIWAHVATAALLGGLDEFETARRGFNRNATPRFSFEVGRVLRFLFGAARSAHLLRATRGERARIAAGNIPSLTTRR